jgi:hypothetical protein
VAHTLWPAGDAIGKRISMEDQPKAGDWLTIVGVVRDVRQENLAGTPTPIVYRPYRQVNQPFFLGHMSFVVQARNFLVTMVSEVRSVLRRVDPELPTQSVTTMGRHDCGDGNGGPIAIALAWNLFDYGSLARGDRHLRWRC